MKIFNLITRIFLLLALIIFGIYTLGGIDQLSNFPTKSSYLEPTALDTNHEIQYLQTKKYCPGALELENPTLTNLDDPDLNPMPNPPKTGISGLGTGGTEAIFFSNLDESMWTNFKFNGSWYLNENESTPQILQAVFQNSLLGTDAQGISVSEVDKGEIVGLAGLKCTNFDFEHEYLGINTEVGSNPILYLVNASQIGTEVHLTFYDEQGLISEAEDLVFTVPRQSVKKILINQEVPNQKNLMVKIVSSQNKIASVLEYYENQGMTSLGVEYFHDLDLSATQIYPKITSSKDSASLYLFSSTSQEVKLQLTDIKTGSSTSTSIQLLENKTKSFALDSKYTSFNLTLNGEGDFYSSLNQDFYPTKSVDKTVTTNLDDGTISVQTTTKVTTSSNHDILSLAPVQIQNYGIFQFPDYRLFDEDNKKYFQNEIVIYNPSDKVLDLNLALNTYDNSFIEVKEVSVKANSTYTYKPKNEVGNIVITPVNSTLSFYATSLVQSSLGITSLELGETKLSDSEVAIWPII